MNEITIGDKVYISAKRAAEITGYARDYVGQLCREGHVDAKMVGRSWYVYEPSIRAHRFGADAAVPQTADSTADPEAEEGKAPEPAAEEPVAEAVSAPTATASDWQTPKYTPEEPNTLPELSPASLEELLPPAEETLTDMQAAWREWFEQKQSVLETPEIESPEIIDDRNEAYEDVYEPVETVAEVSTEAAEEESQPEEEIAVPIHHIAPEPAPVYAPVPPAPRMDIHREIPSVVPEAAPMIVRYSGEYTAPQAPHGRIIEERVITKKGKPARKIKKARTPRGSNAPIIAVLIGISLIAITVALIGTGYAGRYLRTLPSENSPIIQFLVGTQKFSR